MMMLPGNKVGVADGDIRTEEFGRHALTFLAKGNCLVEEAPTEDGSRYEPLFHKHYEKNYAESDVWV